MASSKRKIVIVAAIVVVVLLVYWWWPRPPAQDEAKAAGLDKSHFAQAANEVDAFHDMDGAAMGVQYTREEILGRNTWMAWSGGNEAFWDWLANNSYGTFDLLKTLSSYPCSPEQEERARRYEEKLKGQTAKIGEHEEAGAYGQAGYSTPPGAHESYDSWYASGVCDKTMWPPAGQAPYRYYSRDTRFCFAGLMPEPGFEKPTAPDEYGLCLDRQTGPKDGLDEKIYGRASGALGLRIFKNPEFEKDENAKKRWREAMKDDRFYTDPSFYADRKLVRPYRVGMACSMCHVSAHPLNPPADPEHPQLANFSGTIGAQYFWFGRVFGANVTADNFAWHLLESNRPGAVDTSFVPSDNIDNPRALNAIFNLKARLDNGTRRGVETATGGALDLPDVKKNGVTQGVPHVLWDGADAVGIDAALTRVYINIGEYHQEWTRHITVLTGLGKQSPITVRSAQGNSTYWNATQDRSANLAKYLIKAGYPMHLADAPGGAAYLQDPPAAIDRGKVVFAEGCARCHSSKLPEQPEAKPETKPETKAKTAGIPRLGEEGCIGSRYRECWDNYWRWTETPAFKAAMTKIVQDPKFLDGNYLSNDARIPVDVLKTEICSSLSSNAVEGHVWDNFSSQSYKDLPSVGPLDLYDPLQEKDNPFDTPGGGRGYQRVPSLISVWATAPFLHNNEVGVFTSDPSTKGRMDAFEPSIHQLLWPDKRVPFYHRTSRETYLTVDTAALPAVVGTLARLEGLVDHGKIAIGPIPKGTPINLIANINAGQNDPQVSVFTLLGTVKKLVGSLKKIHQQHLDEAQGTALLRRAVPDLIKVSTCPDFIVNRGHEFGRELSDADKEALIAFLKTF
jgi:mono/diheme cytochrome c family protein